MKSVVRNEQELGQAIRAVRLASGLTQQQLAQKAGVSRAFVIGLERGSKPGAELARVLRILIALDQRITIEQDNKIGFIDALNQLIERGV